MSRFGALAIVVLINGFLSASLFALTSIRSVRVAVVADATYRMDPAWKQKAEELVESTSELYSRNFGIRFQRVDVSSWDAVEPLVDSHTIPSEMRPASGELIHQISSELFLDLEKRISHQTPKVDIMIGLLARRPRWLTTNVLRTIRADAGAATPFSRIVVVRVLKEYDRFPILRYILAHEIGHLFGAFHVVQNGTVMSQAAFQTEQDPPSTLMFDPQNLRLIRLNAFFDFSKGVDGIRPAIAQEIRSIFRESHAPGQFDPISVSYSYEGFKGLLANDLQRAESNYRRAVLADSSYTLAHTSLAVVFRRQGRRSRASVEIATAVLTEPNNTNLRLALGKSFLEEKKWAAALNPLSEAIRLDNSNLEARFLFSVALWNSGNRPDGIREMATVIRESPDDAVRYQEYLNYMKDRRSTEPILIDPE